MVKVFTENDIEILISTMNQTNLDFLFQMFPLKHFSNYNILIVNQSKTQTVSSKFPSVRVINSFDVGLSKSRNLAIDNSIGKILVIADDDIIYQNNFIEKIVGAHNKFNKSTIVNFCAIKENGACLKKYPTLSKLQLNSLEILNISSIEMTINKEKLDLTGIRFDENFGLGSSLETGEEAVFLFDLKHKNHLVSFENQVIVKHYGLTTSNKIDILHKYYIYGAIVKRILISNYLFWLMIKMFFDIKQKKLKINFFSKAIDSFNKGRKKIKVMNYEK
ncbi:glycosyltransferase [Flavobacterium sp. ALJ2]|uniref:glycosyltransferase family 2 protein n=1 Tax=Flavobacterium sp. ALJ2 TaxID=2786960 RepID=UPI00189D71EE|nr:glycosyltransferase [Flavobacterium sp. ALJ2]MBF7090139.1 glycosyltransferase [Flavobacterium sp. ALJ2]